MTEYWQAVWMITLDLAPWLLLGAALAGGLHVLMPAGLIQRLLGGNGFRPVLLASIIGVPMPLCSCAVIPTGIGLRRDGAGNGPSISFLISTPQTGVDSIMVTAAMLGWPFAIFKLVAALLTGVIGGLLAGLFRGRVKSDATMTCCSTKPEPEPAPTSCCSTEPEPESKSCCAEPKPAPTSCCSTEPEPEPKSCCAEPDPAPQACGNTKPAAESTSCCPTEPVPAARPCCDTNPAPTSAPRGHLGEWWHFSVDLLRMLWFWLVIGVLASALIGTLVSGDQIDLAGVSGIGAMLLALVIGAPLYVCAVASVPIAAALVAAGLPSGAALVFLMAGPATNLATMGAIFRAFGAAITAVYLAVILVSSVVLGLLYDAWFGLQTGDHAHHHHHAEEMGPIAIACAVVLYALLAWFMIDAIRQKFRRLKPAN